MTKYWLQMGSWAEEGEGPYTLEEMRALWSDGKLGQETTYRVDGGDEWRSINVLRPKLKEQGARITVEELDRNIVFVDPPLFFEPGFLDPYLRGGLARYGYFIQSLLVVMFAMLGFAAWLVAKLVDPEGRAASVVVLIGLCVLTLILNVLMTRARIVNMGFTRDWLWTGLRYVPGLSVIYDVMLLAAPPEFWRSGFDQVGWVLLLFGVLLGVGNLVAAFLLN